MLISSRCLGYVERWMIFGAAAGYGSAFIIQDGSTGPVNLGRYSQLDWRQFPSASVVCDCQLKCKCDIVWGLSCSYNREPLAQRAA